MFWIILLIVNCIGLTRVQFKDNCGWWTGQFTGLFILTIGLIITIAVLLSIGITRYPEMLGEHKSILKLQERIKDIREAQYEINSTGQMVSGALDNQGQSTVLSNYIKKCALYEADYNDNLTYYKTIKNLWMHKLFGYAWFISSKINELKYF